MKLVKKLSTGLMWWAFAALLAGCFGSTPPAGSPPAGETPATAEPALTKGDAAAKAASPTPAAPAPAPATAAPAAEEEPPPPLDLPAIIEGLQSPYSVRVFEVAEQFRRQPPDVRRSVLAELSAHESASVRDNAWRAFATWATREDIPTLVAALESEHQDVRNAALDLLARMPNDESLAALLKVLENADSRERAEALLVRAGPAAEGAILDYVTHEDAGLRAAAWRVLGEIGTRKGLLILEQAATRSEFQQDPVLQGALVKIRERLRK